MEDYLFQKIMVIDAHTQLTGLVGHPVRHSLSPLLHNYVFGSRKINCVYLCFDVQEKKIKSAIEALRSLGVVGLNITIPFKEKVIKYLDELDKEASFIGAVNTVKLAQGKLQGFNTDGRGFIRALKDFCKTDPQGKDILILGCGGAGRALGVVLALSKAKRIFLYDIDNTRLKKLVYFLKSISKRSAIFGLKTLKEEVLRDIDILINATPVGMKNEPPLVDISLLAKTSLVYDLVYNPPQTPLIQESKKRGLKAFNGLSMLVYQGVESQNIWFPGIGDTSSIMFRALEDAGFF